MSLSKPIAKNTNFGNDNVEIIEWINFTYLVQGLELVWPLKFNVTRQVKQCQKKLKSEYYYMCINFIGKKNDAWFFFTFACLWRQWSLEGGQGIEALGVEGVLAVGVRGDGVKLSVVDSVSDTDGKHRDAVLPGFVGLGCRQLSVVRVTVRNHDCNLRYAWSVTLRKEQVML